MTNCRDSVYVRNTHAYDGAIDISTGGGDDLIEIGDGTSGVDGIYKGFKVAGGSGQDTLFVNDAAATRNKYDGILTPGTLLGILNGVNDTSSDIRYNSIEIVNVDLSQGVNHLLIPSTAQGSVTTVRAQAMDDQIQVNETMGDLYIHAGGGNDYLTFYGLGDFTTAHVYGEAGHDTIWIDGTKGFATEPAVNTLGNSLLRWSGGGGDDTMHLFWSSVKNANIDLFDDLAGVNDVNIDCAQVSCYVLSRENFLANVHNMSDVNSTVERVTLIRTNAGDDTASINTMVLRLNGGMNQMFFDDTFAPMEVFGGPLPDGKCIFCYIAPK